MQAEVFHPEELREADVAAWRAMCAATPAFRNPLLSPEFAKLVGEVRDDARVAVFRDEAGIPAGFLAFHRRPSGFARPIGSAFSDYHALVTPPATTLDGRAALAAARISAYRFGALIDPYGVFAGAAHPGETSYVIEPGPDPEEWLATLKAANNKRYRNWKRLKNKLEREVGEVVITAGDTDEAAFAALLAWKRDQYRRTGVHDVYRPEWARALLQRVFETRAGPLQGMMTTLRAGDRVVAGHFGPALGGVWHGWISAFDPTTAPCGPGFVLMLEVAEVMKTLGLTSYDMAPSHEHYKAPFATSQMQVGEGEALACSASGRRRASLQAAWGIAGADKVEALGRLRRRLDHIATVELSLGGRMLGVVEALAALGKRNAARKAVEETCARDAA